MSIGPARAPISARRHRMTVDTAGDPIADGDGNYTPSWTTSPVAWQVAMRGANAGDLEYAAGGSIQATPTHVVIGPYRPDITTTTRLRLTYPTVRVFDVVRVTNIDEAGHDLEVATKELVS